MPFLQQAKTFLYQVTFVYLVIGHNRWWLSKYQGRYKLTKFFKVLQGGGVAERQSKLINLPRKQELLLLKLVSKKKVLYHNQMDAFYWVFVLTF